MKELGMMVDGPARMRPLVVRIRNWVGDVVLSLPALQLLQDHGYQLHIVARGRWAPALLAAYDWQVLVQPRLRLDKLAQLRLLRSQCREIDSGFDERENALLLPVSFSSAAEMRLAGLQAVGVAREGRSPLLARAEPWPHCGHELERTWDLACRFLRIQAAAPKNIGMRTTAAAREKARALLQALGITGRYALICPFAGGTAATADKADKRWPGFAEFVQRGEQVLGLPMLVNPGPGEEADARQRYAAARIIPGSDLADYAAMLQGAALVVANDTGPAHMAAALGSPVLSILGPTEAARWGPWGPGVKVLQKTASEIESESASGSPAWPDVDEALHEARAMLTQTSNRHGSQG